MTSQILIILGAIPFLVLGSLHAVFTALDMRNPQRLVPKDPAVSDAMADSIVRMAPATTMWRAWVGFNLSHSLGAVVFGLIYLLLAVLEFDVLLLRPVFVYLAVMIGAAYVTMSVKYWFIVPTVGAGLGTLCFLLGAVML